MEKKKTSIQYNLTNIFLFDDVYTNFDSLKILLLGGPKKMKKYLLNSWNIIKEEYSKNDELELLDKNKKVSLRSFKITYNKTKDDIPVFYFSFPKYKYGDGSSKYVALALVEPKPRYFTLEYGENYRTKKIEYFFGEFVIKNEHKNHLNYGKVDNKKLSYFAGLVNEKLKEEKSN